MTNQLPMTVLAALFAAGVLWVAWCNRKEDLGHVGQHETPDGYVELGRPRISDAIKRDDSNG